MGFLDFKGGKVAINTGKDLLAVVTHRFGTSLLLHEANEIVAMIYKSLSLNLTLAPTNDGASEIEQ